MTRARSVEDFKLRGSFEAVRNSLLGPDYADRWNKPLAYWALPSDRRLPLAFLGRTVREILDTPFEELCATPGVGQKKIQSLIRLLHRAARDAPTPTEPSAEASRRGAKDKSGNGRNEGGACSAFDPNAVSEALWVRWRETVLRHRLEREPLGRVAVSLQNLPTVIWRTPLKFYSDRSLAEIRALKTHGEKRVRVILEVFYTIDQALGEAKPHAHFAIRLTPKFAAELEYWINEAVQEGRALVLDDLRRHLALPLLEQTKIDAGPAVYELAAGRLGLGDAPQTVRWQSRRLGVTRARIYQLLDECSRIMAVRWPEGRQGLRCLEDRLAGAGDAEAARFCGAVRELFYPDKLAGAARDEEEAR